MKRTIIILLLFIFTFSNGINISTELSEKMWLERHERYLETQKQEKLRKIIETIQFKAEIKIPEYVEDRYIEYMYETAINFDIPIRTAFRLIYNESRFIDTIVSPKGAYGFMQLMPNTFKICRDRLNFSLVKITDNYANIYIGFYYLKEHHNFWSTLVNSEEYAWALALASYNAGRGRVIKNKGIPPIEETINYVNFILKEHSNPNDYQKYLAYEK